ncbi:MAG: lipopolysaccharide biosynthesis protein [Lautropia sp.]
MSPSEQNPYSASRISRGLKHLLLGKGLTSAAGIGTLLLAVRGLSLAEFAAYSVLIGLVEMISALTNVGVGQVMTRFVPEIYTLGYRRTLRRMVNSLLGLRYAVLIGALLLIWAFLPVVSRWIGLEAWISAFQLYLLTVLFRTVTASGFQVLEAMLHQGGGQMVLATVTVTRFVLVALAYALSALDLTTLIWIEIGTDLLGAMLMLGMLARGLRTSAPVSAAERGWLGANRDRMVSFGLKGYLQHLIIMPFSGVANRLVIGGHLAPLQVALFGFAQSIFDLMQRFLPAQLFVGLIRPVMASRYTSHQAFDELELVANLVLKVNLTLIGLAAVVIAGGGDGMLLFVTAGKYGAPAVDLLLVMCLLMALESWRHVLDLLSHTVERYGMLVFSNAILGASLLLGIALLPFIGIFALPAANCAGLIIANLVVVYWLHATGFPYRHDWRAAVGIAVAVGLAVLCVSLLRDYLENWSLLAAVAVIVYASSCYAVLRPRGAERDLWSKLLVTGRG